MYNNKTKLWLRNELRSLIGITTCCSRYRLPYISDLGYVLWVASSTTQVEHEVIVHFVSARRLPCWLHFIIAWTVLTYKTFSSLIWIHVFFLCKGFVWCAYWSTELINWRQSALLGFILLWNTPSIFNFTFFKFTSMKKNSR